MKTSRRRRSSSEMASVAGGGTKVALFTQGPPAKGPTSLRFVGPLVEGASTGLFLCNGYEVTVIAPVEDASPRRRHSSLRAKHPG